MIVAFFLKKHEIETYFCIAASLTEIGREFASATPR